MPSKVNHLLLLGLLVLSISFRIGQCSEKELVQEDRSLIYLGLGVFNIVRNKEYLNALIEYRGQKAFYRSEHVFIRPLVTGSINSGKGYFIGAGIACNFFLSSSIALTPSFSPGFYSKEKSFDLCYPLEFRSGIELSWISGKGTYFGTMFYHLSNASLGHRNPGTEVLMFYIGIPLGKR